MSSTQLCNITWSPTDVPVYSRSGRIVEQQAWSVHLVLETPTFLITNAADDMTTGGYG